MGSRAGCQSVPINAWRSGGNGLDPANSNVDGRFDSDPDSTSPDVDYGDLDAGADLNPLADLTIENQHVVFLRELPETAALVFIRHSPETLSKELLRCRRILTVFKFCDSVYIL